MHDSLKLKLERKNDHEEDLLGCNVVAVLMGAALITPPRRVLRRRLASRTWFWCMVRSPMAPAGTPSQRSLRRMATRYRLRNPPRPRTPRTKSTRRPQSTPWAGRSSWSATATAGPSSREAGNDPNVAALVYIAAFALDEGESCASIETAVPQASKAFKPDSNGNWWIEQDHFAADFAADIPPAQAHFMAIAQVPISTDSFTHKVTNPAWKNKPTWYMVASSDRSINPIQERMMAKRANAKTVEVNSSHVAYMSHPKEAAKLIEEAATSAHVN